MLGSRAFELIDANGAAAKAGALVGDEVIAVDGASVTDLDGYATMRVITQRPIGTAAALTVVRGATPSTINVTVHAGS